MNGIKISIKLMAFVICLSNISILPAIAMSNASMQSLNNKRGISDSQFLGIKGRGHRVLFGVCDTNPNLPACR